MRKIILVAHISLDGFVARPGGDLSGFEATEENLAFVCKLTEGADAALFGRVSYQLLNTYWPTAKDHPGATKPEVAYSTWYNGAQKIVVSKTLPETDRPDTTIIRDNLPAAVKNLTMQPGKDILVFGSPSVFQLLFAHQLVDGYWIFINPVIFGKGIPLFGSSDDLLKLKLSDTHQFANGELAMYFSRVNK